MQHKFTITQIETPLGTMTVGGTEKGICLLEFADRELLEKEMQSISRNLNATRAEGESEYFHLLREG